MLACRIKPAVAAVVTVATLATLGACGKKVDDTTPAPASNAAPSPPTMPAPMNRPNEMGSSSNIGTSSGAMSPGSIGTHTTSSLPKNGSSSN